MVRVRDLFVFSLALFCLVGIEQCESVPPFRPWDGRSNNLIKRDWGSMSQPLIRLVPNGYDDGLATPRGGYNFNNTRLPSPRLISTTVHTNTTRKCYETTNMFVVFGQFLAHDMLNTATPEYYGADDSQTCCSKPSRLSSSSCSNFSIPTNDWFNKGVRTCFPVPRTDPVSTDRLLPREQRNRESAFIDASHVYSMDHNIYKILKPDLSIEKGYYRSDESQGPLGNLPLMYLADEKEQRAMKRNGFQNDYFMTADVRANINPHLLPLHNIFFREHNRLVHQMLNSTMKVKNTLEEARRIVIAELQHIAYNEYLPVLLGLDGMEKYKLSSTKATAEYNNNTNPGITNAFATAAFRFGHSMVTGIISRYYLNGTVNRLFKLSDTIRRPDLLRYFDRMDTSAYNEIVRGFLTDMADDADVFFSTEMTSKLKKKKFSGSKELLGADIVSLNIQRGREHGLPGYTIYRTYCGLSSLSSWDDYPPEISSELWDKLSTLYDKPEDIDLYTGGLSEDHVAGSLVGPTFHCIIGEQFANLKFGDRYFFSHTNGADYRGSLEVEEISKRTFGDIICQNTDLDSTALRVFQPISDTNPVIPCSDFRRRMDLTKFKFL